MMTGVKVACLTKRQTREADALRESLDAQVRMMARVNVRQIGEYVNVMDFVLREGTAMRPAPLPSGVGSMTAKQCFYNATNLAMTDSGRFVYVEGYAFGVLPVYHGWCLDTETGRVVDPTWAGIDGVGIGTAYIGVAFDNTYVIARTMELMETAAVIDDWDADWPMLRNADLRVAAIQPLRRR